MSKIKEFVRIIITKLTVLLKRINCKDFFTLSFWRDGWKRICIIASAVAVSTLVMILLINGQRDIGSQEVGKQIYQLSQNIRRTYQIRPDFWGLSTQSVIKQKIYPSDMLIDSNNLIGYFGNKVVVGSDINGTPVMPTSKQFIIAYKDLTKPQCVGLVSNKFTQEFWLGVGRVSLINNQKVYDFSWSDTENILPISKSKAKELCLDNNNNIVFHFE